MKTSLSKYWPAIFSVIWVSLAVPVFRYTLDHSGFFDEVYTEAAVRRNEIIIPALLFSILAIGAISMGYAAYRNSQLILKNANVSIAIFCAMMTFAIGYGYFVYISFMTW